MLLPGAQAKRMVFQLHDHDALLRTLPTLKGGCHLMILLLESSLAYHSFWSSCIFCYNYSPGCVDVEPACVWFKRSGRNCKIASAVRCCSAKRVDDRVGAGSVCKFTHGKHFPLPTDPTLRSGGGRFSVKIHTPNALIVKWRVRACPLYDPAFSSLVCEKLGRKASIVKWRCFYFKKKKVPILFLLNSIPLYDLCFPS
mgnify:CR=1 FL=1